MIHPFAENGAHNVIHPTSSCYPRGWQCGQPSFSARAPGEPHSSTTQTGPGSRGLALFATGLCIHAQSLKNFSAKQLGGVPELHRANRTQRLVTEGVRSRVRHPVYLAYLCEMFGLSLGTGLAVCWSLTAFAVLTGAVMIRMEDAELEKRFGDEYRAYRSSVPAVLPRLFP